MNMNDEKSLMNKIDESAKKDLICRKQGIIWLLIYSED